LRLKEIEQRIADLREKSSGMKAKWQSEKEAIDHMRTAKAELEQLRLQLDQARNAGDLGRASEIQYGKIPELERKLKAEQDKLAAFQQDGVMLKEEVDEEDVAEVVAKWTGIPVSRMLEGEMQKLVTMEGRLGLRVIGQEEALTAVANAVRSRSRRLAGSESSDWFVYLSWANGRRQDLKPPARSPSFCSTTNARWCGSTCRSTWRSTPWRA
jgi:ATP-dependent Clp protease ATP-binding subunit ClpB